MFSHEVSKTYSLSLGVLVVSGWLIACLVLIVLISSEFPLFFHFGPADTVFFGPLVVDTWAKWSYVFTYSVCGQIVSSWSSATISPFITNVVRDHKSQWGLEFYYGTQAVVQLYYLYSWITGVLDIFLYLSYQVQFWVPGFVVDLALQWVITKRQLLQKRPEVPEYGTF